MIPPIAAESYTDWYIGLILGFVVVAVVVVIVAIILTVAQRISEQARGAAAGVDTVRAQTTSLTSGVGQVNDSAIRILHMARVLRKAATGT